LAKLLRDAGKNKICGYAGLIPLKPAEGTGKKYKYRGLTPAWAKAKAREKVVALAA